MQRKSARRVKSQWPDTIRYSRTIGTIYLPPPPWIYYWADMTTSNWKRWNMPDWSSNYKRVCQAIYIPTVYTLDLSSHNIGNCLIDAVIFSLRCHLNNGDVEGVLRRLWQRRIKATWMLAGILCVINSTSCHQGIRVHDHPCYPYLPSSTIPSLSLMLACIIECSFTLSGFL